MEWRPAGWSVCLPHLVFPCTIKSRSSLLALAHLGGPGKRAVKRLWCSVWFTLTKVKQYKKSTCWPLQNHWERSPIFQTSASLHHRTCVLHPTDAGNQTNHHPKYTDVNTTISTSPCMISTSCIQELSYLKAISRRPSF